MANSLDQTTKDSIRQAYLDSGSIKEVARKTGCSRNTVKKLLRAEGLTLIKPSVPECAPEIKDRPMTTLDFTFLERLFELNKESGENADFEKHIKKVINELAAELNVAGRTDMLRLEAAIFQFIVYRRFYFLSLKVGDKRYEGPFTRSHEKQAKAVVMWVEASNKALDQFNKLIRELEVKSGKRLPYWGGQKIIVKESMVQIKTETA